MEETCYTVSVRAEGIIRLIRVERDIEDAEDLAGLMVKITGHESEVVLCREHWAKVSTTPLSVTGGAIGGKEDG